MQILEIRNARWDNEAAGIFSAEVLFAEYSPVFIPYTYNPLDREEHSLWITQVWLEDLDNLEAILPELPKPNPETDYSAIAATQAIQIGLDAKAREFGYDSVISAASYATSTSSKFGPEGRAFVAWRDSVWTYAYTLLAQVQAGSMAKPSLSQLLEDLPDFPVVDYENG